MIPVSYNIRSLIARRATTVATALGIGLVVFVFAGSAMLTKGLDNILSSTGSDTNAIVLRKGADAELSSTIDKEQLNQILAAPGVKKNGQGQPIGVGEIVVVITQEKIGAAGISNVSVRGTSSEAYELRDQVRIVEGRKAKPGTNEAVIGQRIAGRFRGVDMGGTFELKKNSPVKVVGVFEAAGSAFESEVWADVEQVRRAFGRERSVSSVTVALASKTQLEAFAGEIESSKRLGLDVMREDHYYEKQSDMLISFFQILGSAIAFFFALGAMIGAMITMYSAVAQRTREIGTLRALGFGRFSILFSFLLEACILAVIGGVIGALASLLMGFVEFATINWATWSEIVFTFDSSPDIVVRSVIAGGVMGIIGGFFPALKAARTNPIEAMRH